MAKKRKRRISDGTAIIEMDDVYRLINRVQMERREAKFSVPFGEGPVVENVLADLKLQYQMRKFKTKVSFLLFPPEDAEEIEEPDLIVEFIDDEILEEGQLF